jgi:hypothetical protein
MIYLNRGKNMKKRSKLFVFILLLGVLFYFKDDIYNYTYSIINTSNESYDIENLPEYDGNSYVIVNDNIPYFKEEEYIVIYKAEEQIYHMIK